jgi:serine/threonine protein kinase
MLTLANYQIGTQIYESANSLVYRGVRKKDNKQVILKMLKEDYPTPAELTRYRQEYEMTHDLDLAGVIKAYGIEKDQNTLVMILDDFGGESLKTTFEKGEQGWISVADFLPIAIQIADSLGNIHTADIIHKDINPANIVWNKTANQLKIIDFGIASRLPRENTTLKNPEQHRDEINGQKCGRALSVRFWFKGRFGKMFSLIQKSVWQKIECNAF